MTQDEIIEMAQECGLVGMRPHLDGIYIESLLAFAKLVAEAERERIKQANAPEIEKINAYIDHAMREVQRLGQEIEQEPVAWIHIMDNTEGIRANGKGIISITQKRKHPFGKVGIDFDPSYPIKSTPLYTAPPQRTWVGLTDKDWNRSKHNYDFQKGVDWAELILKEKNT